MDEARIIRLLEYTKTFGFEGGANGIAIDEAIKIINKYEIIKEELTYYLNNNEENGVVHIPRSVIKKMISNKQNEGDDK